MRFCIRLSHLDVSGCNLQSWGFEIMPPALSDCSALTHLNLSENSSAAFCAEGGRQLAAVLAELRKLTHLDVGSNNVGAAGVLAVAAALQQSASLTHLNISENRIWTHEVNLLPEALGALPALTELMLDNKVDNRQDRQDVGRSTISNRSAVADILLQCKMLSTLSLRCTGIPREGFGLALEGSQTLTFLELCKNKLGAHGLALLASGIERCSTLSYLGLAGNNIGQEAMVILANALKSCPNVESLDLSENELGR